MPRPKNRTVKASLGYWADTDEIADFAHNVCEEVRESDTRALHDHLTDQCMRSPAQMAQVLMALAAWVDPDEPLSARTARVERIAQVKVANVLRTRGVVS